jgi:hypothetical protein
MFGCTYRRAALLRRPAVPVQCLSRRSSFAGLTGAALLTIAAAVSIGEHRARAF